MVLATMHSPTAREPAPVTRRANRHMQVLLNAPNLVGWVRIALLTAAIMVAPSNPVAAWWATVGSLVLDSVDGILARRLGQATHFGAVLDVLIDNATRGWLWCGALPHGLGVVPVILESTVFAFTHAVGK